jgi:hypothetical protein
VKFHPAEVSARYTPDGWPIPASFTWEGATLPVVDLGRRWRDDNGVHLLARVADGRVFELHTNGAQWRAGLVSQPAQFA